MRQALLIRLDGQTHIFRFLQKYLIGFKSRLWLGHTKTFTALCISHSCCVLRVIVLLEGEHSAQPEVLNALDWVFIKAISIFWCIEHFFYSDESLPLKNRPTAWGCYQHTSLLGWSSAGDEQSWFPSNINAWNQGRRALIIFEGARVGSSCDTSFMFYLIFFLFIWNIHKCITYIMKYLDYHLYRIC